MQPLRTVFVVQGEGRGHMTQALALAAALRDAGHEVVRVLVGRSPWRSIPAYFRNGIGAALVEFDAPVQVPGREGTAASVARTLVDAARRAPGFARSVRTIGRETTGADVVVNFLDLTAGVSRARPWSGGRPGADGGTASACDPPVVAVAHNYLFLHPALEGAPGPNHVRRAVLAYARATAAGAAELVALSFDDLPDVPARSLTVAPPLLRSGLDRLDVRDDGHLLAYVLNAGYAHDLAAWQAHHPDVTVHCYVDGGAAALGRVPHRGAATPAGDDPGHASAAAPGFHLHDLDDRAFLDHLASCRAYVGSAGFESLSEAHWLGKPILAVPTEGQFEQTLNAWDAERCSVARAGSFHDLDGFWRTARPPGADVVRAFRERVARGPALVVDAVERSAHIPRS